MRALRLVAAVVVSLLASAAAIAQQPQSYSLNVIAKCQSEAERICPQHALGSAEMRYCMEAKARMIGRDCLVALEDDGIIPRGSSKQARVR